MFFNFLIALKVYFIVSLLGVAAIPLSRTIFSRIKGGSVLLSRVLAILIISYVGWIGANIHVLPYNSIGLWIVAALVLATSIFLFLKDREGNIKTLKEDMPVIWRGEVIFFVLFFFTVYLKMYRNMIFGTEKFMDLAFFSSIYRGSWMPPVDPWLSGESINYYYGGHMIFAGLAKMAMLDIGVGYNMAFPLIFAMVGSCMFVLVYALTKNYWAGLLGVALHSLIGNLDGIRQVFVRLLKNLSPPASGPTELIKWFCESFYPINLWQSTRVVVDATGGETINEYPMFSFYWGDLHPHLTSMPFVLLLLAVLWQLFNRPLTGKSFSALKEDLPTFILLPFSLGALALINGLDYPTFALVTVAVLVLREIRLHKEHKHLEVPLVTPLFGCLYAAGVAALSYLFYIPFFLAYKAPVQGDVREHMLGRTIFKTNIMEFFDVFGIFLFVIVLYVIWRTRLSIRKEKTNRSVKTMAVAFAVAFIIFGIEKYVLVPILFLLVVAGIYLLIKSLAGQAEKIFALTLVLIALCICMAVEFIYIKDGYGHDLQRMNTLLKFYLQVWVMFAVITPFFLMKILRDKLLDVGQKSGIVIGFGILFLISTIIPLATVRLIHEEFRGTSGLTLTLDGQEYLATFRPDKGDNDKYWARGIDPSDEYEAIRWLQANVDDHPVIVEATGDPYRYFGRVSANTGLPTILGWHNHEAVWRKHRPEYRTDRSGNRVPVPGTSIYDMLNKRKDDVRRIYNARTLQEIKSLLKEYDVKYIYVGSVEQENYEIQGLQKFKKSGWDAFTTESVAIYKVPDSL